MPPQNLARSEALLWRANAAAVGDRIEEWTEGRAGRAGGLSDGCGGYFQQGGYGGFERRGSSFGGVRGQDLLQLSLVAGEGGCISECQVRLQGAGKRPGFILRGQLEGSCCAEIKEPAGPVLRLWPFAAKNPVIDLLHEDPWGQGGFGEIP